MTALTRTALLVLTFLCSTLAPALLPAEQALYDVEVIIFTNPGSADDGEVMRTPPPGAAAASGMFAENMFTELSPDLYTLNNIRAALSRTPGYTVLFHRAWRQLGYERRNAVDYPVHSLAANGRDSIEGTITLVRERYLHLDVDLLLMTAAGSRPVLYSDGPGSVPAYRLSENRRMRSNELHYLDHPRFGVIARVTPYELPGEPAAQEPADDSIPVEESVEPDAETPTGSDDQLTR